MRENLKVAFIVSLISIIGIPILFLILSLNTGNWKFFLISIGPALVGGLTLLVITLQRMKQKKQAVMLSKS
ncbi:hypothetical protein DVB69_11540 [Sporosarcina sp. BI001-red]|uniref:hypothetical protein n=1 Tax=Sporosarcina sp. BI001-red TaxID=2282866 RepID=UPI000E22E8DB|nr:hypothetical protein [Sporosarcina sp. BI001-red]REB07452.1 hypothetical protein DVB69_11540 [Sporosarcina sp. BI001-red]